MNRPLFKKEGPVRRYKKPGLYGMMNTTFNNTGMKQKARNLMDRFCRQCGAALREGDQFCRSCGAKMEHPAPAEAEPRLCSQCGKPLKEGDQFCRGCGTTIGQPSPAPAPKPPGKQPLEGIRKTATALLGQSLPAPGVEGELAFEPMAAAISLAKPLAQVQKAIGPAASLVRGAAGFFKGIAAAFRDPKTLIIALGAAALWALPLVLPSLLDNQLFAFLTYGGGGLKGGLPGLLGGLAGKGLIAYLIASLFHGGFGKIAAGLKQFAASLGGKEQTASGTLFLGLGIALVLFNFTSYDGTTQAGMVSASSLLIALQALGSKNGFLRLFTSSFTKGKNQNAPTVDRVLAGFALGSGISLPLAYTGIPFAGYLLGGLLLAAGLILWLAGRGRKEGIS